VQELLTPGVCSIAYLLVVSGTDSVSSTVMSCVAHSTHAHSVHCSVELTLYIPTLVKILCTTGVYAALAAGAAIACSGCPAIDSTSVTAAAQAAAAVLQLTDIELHPHIAAALRCLAASTTSNSSSGNSNKLGGADAHSFSFLVQQQ
jgi:hypothetical protein